MERGVECHSSITGWSIRLIIATVGLLERSIIDNKVYTVHQKALYLTAVFCGHFRLHTISSNKKYLKLQQEHLNTFQTNLWIKNLVVYFWTVDYKGSLETKKQMYAQAFAIYGLSEFYTASQIQKALQWQRYLQLNRTI